METRIEDIETRTKRLEEEHKGQQYEYCNKCGRVTGLKYEYPDGKGRAISLRKLIVNGEVRKLICSDCYEKKWGY